MLTYLFWPHPEAATYDNPKVIALLLVCVALILLGFGIRRWRLAVRNPITRRLSRSWISAAMALGLTGIVLCVARVEQISYISMRFWWLVWVLSFVLVFAVQWRRWRALHYEVLPRAETEDPREKYLPKRKKR